MAHVNCAREPKHKAANCEACDVCRCCPQPDEARACHGLHRSGLGRGKRKIATEPAVQSEASTSSSTVFNEEQLLARVGLGQDVETCDNATCVRNDCLDVSIALPERLLSMRKKLVGCDMELSSGEASEKRKDIMRAAESAARYVLAHFLDDSSATLALADLAQRLAPQATACDAHTRMLMRSCLLCKEKQQLLDSCATAGP
jgi:hypothetical protein